MDKIVAINEFLGSYQYVLGICITPIITICSGIVFIRNNSAVSAFDAIFMDAKERENWKMARNIKAFAGMFLLYIVWFFETSFFPEQNYRIYAGVFLAIIMFIILFYTLDSVFKPGNIVLFFIEQLVLLGIITYVQSELYKVMSSGNPHMKEIGVFLKSVWTNPIGIVYILICSFMIELVNFIIGQGLTDKWGLEGAKYYVKREGGRYYIHNKVYDDYVVCTKGRDKFDKTPKYLLPINELSPIFYDDGEEVIISDDDSGNLYHKQILIQLSSNERIDVKITEDEE